MSNEEQTMYDYYNNGEPEEPLYIQIQRRETLDYINHVNSVIRRTPLQWSEQHAEHALKAILACLTSTYHLKITNGLLDNAWLQSLDEAIDVLNTDKGLE